jgi:dephospho-CoA kinase
MASQLQRLGRERLVIGITGRIGSGKTTVGGYLESKYGFQYLRYSAVLADWLAKDPESKDRLQEIGWQVMAGGTQAELNGRLIAQIRPSGDVAVDGLRHPLDYDTLSKSFPSSFHLIFIDSPAQTRFARLRLKGKYQAFSSFETADSHPVEQHIDSLQANAQRVIYNEHSLDNLYAVVDEVVGTFRKEGQS